MQTLHSPSPHSLAWETDVRATYRTLSPRALVVEILDLHAEVVESAVLPATPRQVVALLAGRRLTLARTELCRRVREQRA